MYTILFYYNMFFRFQKQQMTMTELYANMMSIEDFLVVVFFLILCLYICDLLDGEKNNLR
jgi:hypothetical protein